MPNSFRHSNALQEGRTQAPSGARFQALDGLRGLAALAVLVHHIILSVPSFDALRVAGPDPANSPLFWLATYTPLHIFWAGSEAVYVFFILSGFVLALPFLRAEGPGWMSYYPKRIVRLYLPVWGSIVLAVAATIIIPRAAHANASEWITVHEEPFDIVRNLILLAGTDQLNSPLWSLQWEVLFSLLLPIYLYLGRKAGRFWVLAATGLVALVGAGSVTHIPSVTLMPMFGIGVLMAINREALATWASRASGLVWFAIISASIVLLTSAWVLPGVPGSTAMAAVGAGILIFSFLFFRPAVRLGTRKSFQWAGSRSFSLYVTHEPIVVAVSLATQTDSLLVVAAIAIPVSLLVCEIFFRIVERPSHRLAVSLGRIIDRSGRTPEDLRRD